MYSYVDNQRWEVASLGICPGGHFPTYILPSGRQCSQMLKFDCYGHLMARN